MCHFQIFAHLKITWLSVTDLPLGSKNASMALSVFCREQIHVFPVNGYCSGDMFRGEVIGTCHFEKKFGVVIPCHYLKNGTQKSV